MDQGVALQRRCPPRFGPALTALQRPVQQPGLSSELADTHCGLAHAALETKLVQNPIRDVAAAILIDLNSRLLLRAAMTSSTFCNPAMYCPSEIPCLQNKIWFK